MSELCEFELLLSVPVTVVVVVVWEWMMTANYTFGFLLSLFYTISLNI